MLTVLCKSCDFQESGFRHSALAFLPEASAVTKAACSQAFTEAVLSKEVAFGHSSALASHSSFFPKAALPKEVVFGHSSALAFPLKQAMLLEDVACRHSALARGMLSQVCPTRLSLLWTQSTTNQPEPSTMALLHWHIRRLASAQPFHMRQLVGFCPNQAQRPCRHLVQESLQILTSLPTWLPDQQLLHKVHRYSQGREHQKQVAGMVRKQQESKVEETAWVKYKRTKRGSRTLLKALNHTATIASSTIAWDGGDLACLSSLYVSDNPFSGLGEDSPACAKKSRASGGRAHS